ncbi:sugar ABC transporter substrate-binding protein [Desmospora activa]|uniref:Monosaccharide ABC transporter substrate-binding protein (CUT2 family) n=1 Tax=Desmospora activa DSM 45169 TaxID=1121389 RepID=A0A2T4Z7R1_9BACL|nr:sugar ABC transporter substrate-binding protein [Desmospora activa]PTM57905.1 monosaccharide ABC transporter substrate-binding protein (CUT2 family) [Desmospora activa DSM 45169]
MRTKKAFHWSIVLVLVSVGLLSGCGQIGAGSNGDGIVIGAAMPVFDDKWLSYLYDAINQYDKEHDDVEVSMVDAKNDSSKQLEQVEKFIVQGVDAIVITPVDTSAVEPMVNAAKQANIPVVVVNRMPDEDVLAKLDAYVGSESIEGGIKQMEEVEKLLEGKGNVAIMTGELGHESQIKRTEGNQEVVKKNPEMKVVREGTAKYQRAEGIRLMENWIQSGTKIDAVVANNDEMAIGAISALKAAGKLDDTIVAGIDGTPDALEYIQSGELEVSVFQDPVGQGEGAIETAVKLAQGEKLEDKMVWVPYELITKENVEEYVQKWEEYNQ